MPIQEEEKASGKPAAKARPMLKPSSTSGWDSTPTEQRQWIDIKIQESKDLYYFQVSKFIARLLRYSHQVNREEDAGVHYDQVIDEFKEKLSDDTGYWSDEMLRVLHLLQRARSLDAFPKLARISASSASSSTSKQEM